jgi:site-specific DNA-cytosine methylase
MSTLQRAQPLTREVRHFHLFCGLGGGAKGFNRGHARVGRTTARFRCIGGIDNDPAAIKDFSRLAGAEGTCLDLFSRDQYIAFHGEEPPIGWTEATPQDLQRAARGERPHIIFLSAPCKGFSGLLPEAISKCGKYQALNALTLRGI